MDFINIHTSVLDSVEFIEATAAQQGTWLRLYRYCAGQENSGKILTAKAWSDRVWLKVCGVSLREVNAKCGLWSWEGDTLVLSFYNLEAETSVERLRSIAVKGAHARWLKHKAPLAMPAGMPQGTAPGNATGNADATAKGNEKEGNERKGNETTYPPADAAGAEGQVTTRPKRASKPGASLPSEHPEPMRARMIRVGALKGRGEGTLWSAAELAAFRMARLDGCADHDFENQLAPMQAYYRAVIPREMDYRRRELLTLLNHWSGELDKARAHCRDKNDGIVIR